MKKLEHIKLDFNRNNEKQQALYCPFSGGLLVPADPYEEIEQYPENVIAVFVLDYLDTPHYLRKDFKESDFSELEDLEEIKSILRKKSLMDSGILIIEAGFYGNSPHDYGGWVIILEAPNCFLN